MEGPVRGGPVDPILRRFVPRVLGFDDHHGYDRQNGKHLLFTAPHLHKMRQRRIDLACGDREREKWYIKTRQRSVPIMCGVSIISYR